MLDFFMSTEKEISIVIPVYNEEKRITKCLNRVLDFCSQKQYNFEVIVAEDGSSDNTVQIVQEFQKKSKIIKLISFKKRIGKGAAIANAILKAEKKYVGYMDVDLATDPSEFERFFEEIENYDVIIGSRLIRGNLMPIKRPFYRTLFSTLYSKFFRFLFNIPVYDTQCGFKLFRREIVSELFSGLHVTGFAFDSEIIVKSYILGLRLKEIPVIWNHNNASKISVMTQVREMSRDLLSIWYQTHLLWRDGKQVYPQKRNSLKARILFNLISFHKKATK